MKKSLINTADLSALIASNTPVKATASAPEGVEGFLLFIKGQGQEMVLSTYLSDKPRLFKRADALLNEAEKMGLSMVCFELKKSR